MDSADQRGATLFSTALLILAISAGLRAVDNMISTTVPLLGTYVFLLGTVYGGVFAAIYNGSSLVSNWFVNPRLTGAVRKKAFLLCGVTISVAVFALAAANAVVTLVIGIASGLAMGILYTNVAASASSYAMLYRSERLISIFALGFSISLVLGPVLETYLLAIGYTEVFLVFGCVAVISFVLSSRIRLSNMSRTPTKISPLARRGLIHGILTYAVFFVPFGAISVFLPIYAKDVFDISTALAYSSFVPLYAVSLLARLLMVARPPRRIERLIVVTIVVTLGGLAAMFLAPTFGVFLVAVALLGIPHGVTFTVSLIIVARTSTDEERNTTNSRLTAVYSIFSIVVPVATSSISESIGIREAFLLLLIPVVLTSAVLLRSFRAKEKPGYLIDHSWND